MMAGKKRAVRKEDITEYMSAEELKSRFYDYFRDSGTFADLRAQLRSKLVNEMFKSSSNSYPTDNKDDPENSLLPLQVGNWLVYDHMKRLGLEYSLSTFVSEANLPYPKKILSVKDILHIFGMDSTSPEYELIHSAYMNNKNRECFLCTFLNIIVKKAFSDISRNYPSKVEPTRNKEFFPFSEFNPSKVFRETFNDPEPSFKEAASNIETVMYKQLQLEKDKHEKEIQQLRQKLLLELDTLYTHEQQARVELERRKIKLAHEQELLELQKEKFKMKEVELNGRLKGLELEAEQQLNGVKESLAQKQKELDVLESKLNEKQHRLEKEQTELKTKYIQSETIQAKFTELQHSYKILQNEYTAILKKNEELQVNLNRVSDYSIVKEEIAWKSKKLEHFEKELLLLRMQLHEERSSSLHTIKKLQQQMMNEMSMPHLMSQYMATMQKDQPPNNEGKSPEHESKSSQQHKELLTRLEDQRQDIQELHRLIHNLHYQPPTKQDHAASFISLQTNEPATIPSKSSPNWKSLHQSNPKQKLYEETNQRIQELIKETDAMEQKYTEYMFGRPNLYPNIYIPYNVTSAQLHLDVATPLMEDKSQFQNLSNSFKNFDLDFAPKTYYDPKFVKSLAKISCDQEHAQDFFQLLRNDEMFTQSYGVMLAQAYDTAENKSKALSTDQPISSDLSPLQSASNFTLNKTVEKKLPINGQKTSSPGAFQIEKVTHNDVLQGNTPNLIIDCLRSETDSHHLLSQSLAIVNDKVENGSGDKTAFFEECNTEISNDARNLYDKSREDPIKSALKMSDVQIEGETTCKLDNHVCNQEKLPIDSPFLEPLVNKGVGDAVSDNLVDLDAVWKQQTKTNIFKINSSTKNIYTGSSNETEFQSIKNFIHSENKTRQKLSLDEIPKPSTALSPPDSASKNTVLLNPNFKKDTAQLRSVSEKDVSPQNLTSAPEKNVFDSVSKKDVLSLNPISEKKTLNSVPEKNAALPNLTLAAPQSNLTSEKGTSILPLEPELIQKSNFSQEPLMKPASDNEDSNVHNDEQITNKSISSEPSTPGLKTNSSKGSKISLDKKESELNKNGSSLHGSLHTLEAKNSVSEISSSELDEKDSSNPNVSELNLSAGSCEVEPAKDEAEDDGW